MKIDPVSIILETDFKIDKKFYFISGNETTLIQKINTKIVSAIKKEWGTALMKIDAISEYVDEMSFFEEKKIVLVNSCKDLNEKSLNKVRDMSDIFIFVQENSSKIKKIKNIFLKDKDSYLVDCYELDRGSKIKVLNEFIRMFKINIEKDLYWILVDKLDNKYGFFENCLSKILELEQEDITLDNIKKLLTIDDAGKDKIFFSLFKKNKDIVQLYREKVINMTDIYEFYYYCRFFCQLIIDSKNEDDYNKNIPIYLFKERNFLVDLYRKYNTKKKISLLNLLSYTEKALRKDANLSLIFGLRFILNIKKITIS
tara:strand:- start:836 stop:1774 length:939 start_codon:yes stop_codon:yes gene_type:complete